MKKKKRKKTKKKSTLCSEFFALVRFFRVFSLLRLSDESLQQRSERRGERERERQEAVDDRAPAAVSGRS